MQIQPVMPFKMATTTISWTRMVGRKSSNLKTYRLFGIFNNQPISHFLQMREVRDMGEMRELHRPEAHQHISQRLTFIGHIGLAGQDHAGNLDPIVGLGDFD